MFIKKKHIVVAIFSSIIIAAVFISTLVMYTIYIQWKKDNLSLRYENSVYKLTAELFRKNILISNIGIKFDDRDASQKMPIFEGTLRNNTDKTIVSLLLELSFVDANGVVIYKDWFHPLGERPQEKDISDVMVFTTVKHTKKILPPGETVSFRYTLRNCPKEVAENFAAKTKFAKNQSKDKIKMNYSIEGLEVM